MRKHQWAEEETKQPENLYESVEAALTDEDYADTDEFEHIRKGDALEQENYSQRNE